MENCLTIEVQNLRSGCQEAFKILYLKHHKKILGFCLKYGLSMDDAEEIAQVVFVKLWETREKLDPQKNISSYLMTIAKHTIFDSLKAKIKDQAHEVYQMNYLQPVNNVERDMNLLDLQSRVEHALLQLPERRRQVFELSRIQGLSHKEISQELGISPKTVENHLTLAIQDFKTAFGDHQIVQNLALVFLFAEWV